MIQKMILFCSLLCFTSSFTMYAQPFIEVEGRQFLRDGQPYQFIGTNFWYGMHLGMAGEQGDRERLLVELDLMKEQGINNLRVMASAEGPDTEPWRVVPSLQPAPGELNEDLLVGLDFLLDEMGKREMYAVMCLNNFWQWSGGMAQYVSWTSQNAIPYPTPTDGSKYPQFVLHAAKFYKNAEAMKLFDQFIEKIVTRTNTITGKAYVDAPAIMSWQLANEPRGIQNPNAYRTWIERTANFIKSLDANHLVSLGSEGNTSIPKLNGLNFRKDHAFDAIDYTTIHIWIQNWGWYDPTKPESTYPKAWETARKYAAKHIRWAKQMNKPIVIEEFGIARDQNDHAVEAPVYWRNVYYQDLFAMVVEEASKNNSPLAGCNFWAWGGLGRPSAAKSIWKAGDDLIGDPPHEYQGWYSVYDQDTSTLELVRIYNAKLQQVGE
ncbi:MAG: cellulase family glycosylhydrolase [Bacteroidota bacterium]